MKYRKMKSVRLVNAKNKTSKRKNKGGMFTTTNFSPQEKIDYYRRTSRKNDGQSLTGMNVRNKIFGTSDCNEKYEKGLFEGDFEKLTYDEKKSEYVKCCKNQLSGFRPAYCSEMKKRIDGNASVIESQKSRENFVNLLQKYNQPVPDKFFEKNDSSDNSNSNSTSKGGKRSKKSKKAKKAKKAKKTMKR